MIVRPYTEKDFEQLLDIQRECFPPPFPPEQWWNTKQLSNHIRIFPQGALCVELDEQLLGSSTALIVNWHPGDPSHSWEEVTDGGYIRTHNPHGNTLYGFDVAVRPAWRKQGVATLMYQARYALVKVLKLDRFMAGWAHAGILSLS